MFTCGASSVHAMLVCAHVCVCARGFCACCVANRMCVHMCCVVSCRVVRKDGKESVNISPADNQCVHLSRKYSVNLLILRVSIFMGCRHAT